MIKKSIIEKQKKKMKSFLKFNNKKNIIKNLIKKSKKLKLIYTNFLLNQKLQKFPKNSIKVKIKNYCWHTKKLKSYYNFFGLCRNSIKLFASKSLIPGLIKSSW